MTAFFIYTVQFLFKNYKFDVFSCIVAVFLSFIRRNSIKRYFQPFLPEIRVKNHIFTLKFNKKC